MGNRSSRKTTKKSVHFASETPINPSKKNSDRESFHQRHANTHYNAINEVLNQHIDLLHSNPNIPPAAISAHQNSLTIAMQYHQNANDLKISNAKHAQKFTYTLKTIEN